ncbi:family 78 glycoside hydrolase catalytic domain [Paenibacillus sp. GCM10027626]|uniref:family 78 glycoside hydrolase catalytic domain n=1 Tax=Paenibacillus sp. GCM10027626 TaxID=3273411 RepID=UPI003636FDAF
MSRQWKAEWIWGGETASPRNEWRCFRKTFEWSPQAGEALLHISADSRYVLYLNGKQVGRGPVRSWPKEQFYDTYEVNHLLTAGENTIAVHVLHFGVTNFYYLRGQGGLIAELTAASGNGERAVLVTDGSWKTSVMTGYDKTSTRMSCQQGFAEIYDATSWDAAWKEGQYNDAAWEQAKTVGAAGSGPWKSLIPRDIPFLTEEKMMPSRINTLSKVKPPAWTAALDLRAAFVPDSVEHANHVSYAGYLAAIIDLETAGDVTLGFPCGIRNDRVWISGRRCENWQGVRPEHYCTVHLEAGEHLLLIDITSGDHGGGFHIAIDSASNFALRSPLPEGERTATPFALVGPFDAVMHLDHKETASLNREHPDYLRAAGTANREELAAFAEWLKPLDTQLYSAQDVMGASIWRTEAVEMQAAPSLEHGLIASSDFAELPVYDGYDTELLIDFGKEWSGFIGFELDAAEGTVVDLYGIEYVRGEYRQHTYGLDNTIRYRCREGRQQYLSPVRRGFRYLIVTVRGAKRPVKLYELYVNQSNYPVTEAGAFRSADPLLNQIWEISRHTTRLCMEDTFVDCPSYEQVFWVGDSRNEALVNYYVYGSLDIVKRCLNLVPGSSDVNPLYLDQVPSGWNSVIPNWTFFWVIACEEYVQHTGDEAFAASIWPAVRHTLVHYLQNIDDSGLLNMKGWNLLDWAPIDQPNDGIVTHQNMFLCKALRVAGELARAAGIGEDQYADLSAAADALKAAINERLWDERQQAYLDCIHVDGRRSAIFSMQTQVVATLCGIAEGERKGTIDRYLLNPPANFVQIGSPFMSFFYYEALAGAGQYEHMLADIRKHYGLMVEHDATTCWEMYPNFAENRANPDQLTRSHCHAWSAGPGYFLGTTVLGVNRMDRGWSKVAIAPQPCGLSWATGRVPLPQGGRIEVDWRVNGDSMSLRVTAPAGIELDIRVPDGLQGDVQVTRIEP